MSETDQLDQMRRQRDEARKKAAVANNENGRLREEIRQLRRKNYMMQVYADNPSTQAGYRVRYEKLVAAFEMARDILNPHVHGLPDMPPRTLEDPNPPSWARVPVPRPEDKS